MNSDEAIKLLFEYTKSDSLIRHALCVSYAMECYAQKLKDDKEKWGIVGLLHDFDYEMFPENHPYEGSKILKEKGVDKDMIDAILSHAAYTNIARETMMAKALFAVDETSGFLYAYALVRETKNLKNINLKSLKKKFKDKAFAKGINRDDIKQSCNELNVNLDEHLMFVAQCLQKHAIDIGLNP